MGIANAVSIARSNVPRAIGSLKDSGYVIERQAHITGVTRNRKAYFLTDEGISLSDEVWATVSERVVKAIRPGGKVEEMTIGDIVSNLRWNSDMWTYSDTWMMMPLSTLPR